MGQRHKDALAIQMGAVNPSGMAHSIIKACAEVREENGSTRDDAAVRLMVHQLAFICRVYAFDTTLDEYDIATRECEEKSALVAK